VYTSSGSSSQVPLSDHNMGQGSNLPTGSNGKLSIYHIITINYTDTDNLAAYLKNYEGMTYINAGVGYPRVDQITNVPYNKYMGQVFDYITIRKDVPLRPGRKITPEAIELISSLKLDVPKDYLIIKKYYW
jgi:hypothetical protein